MARKKGQKIKFQLTKALSIFRKSWKTRRATYITAIILVIIVLAFGSLFVLKKNWFVVAMVNNRPITSIELYQKLNQQYGQAVLDSLIQEKLIKNEAKKQKVAVSTKELDGRLKEIEEQLGGKEALDYALKSRNLSLEQVKDQIKTQLLVEKMLGKDVEVTDADVETFIKDNPTAKDLSKDKIKEQVRSQKINEKFPAWLEELKKNAKISKFI